MRTHSGFGQMRTHFFMVLVFDPLDSLGIFTDPGSQKCEEMRRFVLCIPYDVLTAQAPRMVRRVSYKKVLRVLRIMLLLSLYY